MRSPHAPPTTHLCRGRQDITHRERLVLRHALGEGVPTVGARAGLVVLPDGRGGGSRQVPSHHELDREDLRRQAKENGTKTQGRGTLSFGGIPITARVTS